MPCPATLRSLWSYVGPVWRGRGVDRVLSQARVSKHPADSKDTRTGKQHLRGGHQGESQSSEDLMI